MTDTARNGFTIGPSGFRSRQETAKTVLQELHRLEFGDVNRSREASAQSARRDTRNAFDFAEENASKVDQSRDGSEDGFGPGDVGFDK